MMMLAALLLGVGTAGCTADDRQADRASVSEGPAIVALLTDRSLVRVATTTGAVLARMRIGPRSSPPNSGRFLALTPDGGTLFVLTPGAASVAQVVAVVDPEMLQVRSRISVPAEIIFRALVVGPASGRLYLFGNRPVARGRGAEDAVIAIVDPTRSADIRTWTIRDAEGHDWWVFDAAVSGDESRLYVSYHGGCSENFALCTSGADWLDADGGELTRCRRPSLPANGCISRVHGSVEVVGNRFLATTGAAPILEIRGARIARRWKTRLAGNHVMEFAVDSMRDQAYVVGQCYYVGGVSLIDIKSDQTRVVTRDVCGDRVAVGDDLVAVAEQFQAAPQAVRSRIALISRTGQAVRYVSLPLEALDLAFVP